MRPATTILPPSTPAARRLAAKPLRWRSTCPTLAALRSDRERRQAISTTPTEPAAAQPAA